MLHRVLYVLVAILKWSEAARILSYQPMPYYSHQKVTHGLTEALALDGHQVLAFSAPRKQPVANITEIAFDDTCSIAFDRLVAEGRKRRGIYAFPDELEISKLYTATVKQLSMFVHPQIKALIEEVNQKFDLIITDPTVPVVGMALRARFETPILLASPFQVTDDLYHLVGADTNAYFYPNFAVPIERTPSLRQELSFYYNLARFTLATRSGDTNRNAFIRRFIIQHAPTFRELQRHVGMLFLNLFRFWDRNRPVPIGSVLYMGGCHLEAPKALPEDLKSFADQSKRGVVMMNMGSKIKSSTLPARTRRVITDVFSRLPYDFIWKWDAEEMPNKPSNLRIVKNMPQNDLLHHPNVRAFVTHGGLLSTHEALAAGVPLVGLPVMPDQWLNTRLYEELGIGIRLDIDFLNEEDFKNAVVAVVEDKMYRENMLRWSRIAFDEREHGLKTAARWARRLATHGARLLRCPLADTTLADFYMLDVISLAAICVFVVAVAIVSAVKRLISALKHLSGKPFKKNMA